MRTASGDDVDENEAQQAIQQYLKGNIMFAVVCWAIVASAVTQWIRPLVP